MDTPEKAQRRAQLQQQEVENMAAEAAQDAAARAMRETSDHERTRAVRTLQDRRNAEAEDIERRRQAAQGQKRPTGRAPSAPPYRGPSAPPDKQLGSAQLDRMTIAELKALAAARGIEAPRLDGKAGEARKADYIAALSA